VDEIGVTEVAGLFPKLTVGTISWTNKLLPTIVTVVPPLSGPDVGVIEAIVGPPLWGISTGLLPPSVSIAGCDVI
jgi:hypothetical protein